MGVAGSQPLPRAGAKEGDGVSYEPVSTTTTTSTPPATTGSSTPPVTETVKEVAARSAGEAKQLSSEVLDGARQLVRSGRTEVTGQLQQQTTRAAGAARTAAAQLFALANGDTQQAERAQTLVRDLGSRLQGIADRLETGGFDGIARQASDFARRRPAAFLGGMALAGFVAGRYAKVLMDRSDDDDTSSSYGIPGGNGARYEPAMGSPTLIDPVLPVDPVTGTPMTGTDPSGAGYGVSTAPGTSFGTPTPGVAFDSPPLGTENPR
jgi:hypothetical protein